MYESLSYWSRLSLQACGWFFSCCTVDFLVKDSGRASSRRLSAPLTEGNSSSRLETEPAHINWWPRTRLRKKGDLRLASDSDEWSASRVCEYIRNREESKVTFHKRGMNENKHIRPTGHGDMRQDKTRCSTPTKLLTFDFWALSAFFWSINSLQQKPVSWSYMKYLNVLDLELIRGQVKR